MTYQLKKNHLTNWDMQPAKDRPIFHNDRDSYISERSSIPSLDGSTPLKKPNHHPPVPPKEPHKLVYPYNQLPENGIPLAVQSKKARKEEEKMRKELFRKAPPGQGSLEPVPEPDSSDMVYYYPYWYHYKATHPDWIMRHRQHPNGQMIPYDSFDPSQYTHPPAATTPSKKSRRHGKKPHHDSFELQYNQEKKCYEWVRKDLKQSSLEPHIPLNDHFNIPRSQSHEKLKTEDDWTNHYIQSKANKLSEEHSHTSKHHHSKKSRHHHHHHHHRHHHHHHHHEPKEYQVRDNSFKKSERTPFFQPSSDFLSSSPPAIYNQSSYLPPIPQEKSNLVDHSSTQTFESDWKSPRTHKRDSQMNFYDRYLNDLILKKIVE